MSLQLFEFLQPGDVERRLHQRELAAPVLNMELKETDDVYSLVVDAPGVPKEDIKLNFENGVLSVSVEHKEEHVQRDEKVHFTERSYGHSSRAIRLPKSIAADKITAKHANGVLTVTVPKQDQSRTKYIQIQ
ncbi:SHSP domain-containing protein [Plasmodiophora brassicae]|uniref:SHSP domain-containing protein n=1 Tax=Plasmodiophora brassicae TaxID=37360 RepID=A0A0G4IMG4_PLABS|nr:hypothetical protein PBRA_004958 [Plasmodiophora brassicae]SPQ99225.1 unnamed protein product [Plasmodiophora brassicae]